MSPKRKEATKEAAVRELGDTGEAAESSQPREGRNSFGTLGGMLGRSAEHGRLAIGSRRVCFTNTFSPHDKFTGSHSLFGCSRASARFARRSRSVHIFVLAKEFWIVDIFRAPYCDELKAKSERQKSPSNTPPASTATIKITTLS